MLLNRRMRPVRRRLGLHRDIGTLTHLCARSIIPTQITNRDTTVRTMDRTLRRYTRHHTRGILSFQHVTHISQYLRTRILPFFIMGGNSRSTFLLCSLFKLFASVTHFTTLITVLLLPLSPAASPELLIIPFTSTIPPPPIPTTPTTYPTTLTTTLALIPFY